jgi:hypothetical protein
LLSVFSLDLRCFNRILIKQLLIECLIPYVVLILLHSLHVFILEFTTPSYMSAFCHRHKSHSVSRSLIIYCFYLSLLWFCELCRFPYLFNMTLVTFVVNITYILQKYSFSCMFNVNNLSFTCFLFWRLLCVRFDDSDIYSSLGFGKPRHIPYLLYIILF